MIMSPEKYFTLILFTVLVCLLRPSVCLNNGLARTPPMGWMAWERFACNIDCLKYPNNCISEVLFKQMADRLVADGYRAAGYEYLNIDDCWPEKQRDPKTLRIVADQQRFPSGIKTLADYIHSKGLKIGIYGDIGTKTCAGYPGFWNGSASELDFFLLDAETFAEWGIDSLKVDGCYADTPDFKWMYPKLGRALNLTGRPMLYGCSWPAYMIGGHPNYSSINQHCNLWRNFDDISDSWQSVTSIIDFYAKNQDEFSSHQSPGAWFDPDMIIVGNFGLSWEQSKAQMAFWCLFSAPLLMSNDLRQIAPEMKEILLNRHLISVDQDPMGKMGKRIFKQGRHEVWEKPMLPMVEGEYSLAIIYFNRDSIGGPSYITYPLSLLRTGWNDEKQYYVYDLFQDGRPIAKLNADQNLTLLVNPSGSVRMVKLVPALIQPSSDDTNFI